MPVANIDPRQFLDQYESGALNPSTIIDVREPHEWNYYHLEHTKLLPMRQLPNRLDELPPDRAYYIICAHGVRSAVVAEFLSENQYPNVMNVIGGMAAIASLRGFDYD